MAAVSLVLAGDVVGGFEVWISHLVGLYYLKGAVVGEFDSIVGVAAV